jgi:hypothetical protein
MKGLAPSAFMKNILSLSVLSALALALMGAPAGATPQ